MMFQFYEISLALRPDILLFAHLLYLLQYLMDKVLSKVKKNVHMYKNTNLSISWTKTYESW